LQTLGRVVKLLDCDPELAGGLDGERLARAVDRVRAITVVLPSGRHADLGWSAGREPGFGLLVVEGLLVRRVSIGGRVAAELLGPGDLLRPWRQEEAHASIACSTGWKVLECCRLAELDADFSRRLQGYPEIQERLVARALARARTLAVNLAIVHQPKVETRIVLLLWHLADRWGRVRPDGVLVPLALSHRSLAELLAAQRPTVSRALRSLEQRGLVTCSEDGWVLHGTSPAAARPRAREQSPASVHNGVAGARRVSARAASSVAG
jgi:CRP-like cAMP-binding protein